jgi:hypothetical protein
MPVEEAYSSSRSFPSWATTLRPIIIAVLAGVALFFTLPFAISALFGDNTRWYLTLLVAPYAIAGVVLGIVWPQMSWQIGIWLFAVWPPALSFDFFLTAEVPSDRKKDLQN